MVFQTFLGHNVSALMGKIYKKEFSEKTCNKTLRSANIFSWEEFIISQVSGSFVAVTHYQKEPRVYPDHGATIPMVFDRKRKIAGK